MKIWSIENKLKVNYKVLTLSRRLAALSSISFKTFVEGDFGMRLDRWQKRLQNEHFLEEI